MSLRKDIKEWIGLNSNPNYVTDKIMEEIEKRINSIPLDNFKGGIYTKESLLLVEQNIINRMKEMLK